MLRLLVVAVLTWLVIIPAFSQHIHHHNGMSPEVDRFYSTWKKPNKGQPRYFGCCDRTDCYPVQAQFRSGHWWFLHRETNRWMMVPDEVVEHEQPDPRESPDGGNHVCASPYGTVYCFTVGSQG